jgi:adenosine deaminase
MPPADRPVDWESMPKVELHLHLEGAIPLPTMWGLVERHGGDPDVPDPAALGRRFEYRDFAHFIKTWEWKLRFHTTVEDYELLAAAVAEDLARQGHRYVEAYVSPTDSPLPAGELLHAVRRGLDRHPAVMVALVPDLVRDTRPEMAMRTLEAVLEVAPETGVIGITIGGSEQLHPAAPFAPVFERARRAGLRLTAHAGEAAGPESVRQAVDDLGVDRIGHGVRAVEDPGLMAELVQRQIPLEVCPTSNVRTGVVGSLDEHPIRWMIEQGAFVTVNTDDPAMFGCSLAGEYAALHALGVDLATLRMLSENAVDASWASPTVRRDLHLELATWWREQSGAPVA